MVLFIVSIILGALIMKKILLLILVFTFASISLSAAKFNSVDSIKMVSTEHFDIIYNDKSSRLASEIKDICEDAYEKICQTYDIKEGKRFPVIISADIEEFNSYFRSGYPESIVIFDTIVANDSFNFFGSNNMAKIFTHELTHALTLTDVDSIPYALFGFDYATINTNSFQKEGVAVYFESIDGEGRLNNSLENSKLIEAKAEGKFPNYQEASVSRILHRYGNYYLFGSTFYEYLINTYGIDKFNEYYNKITSFNFFFMAPEIVFNNTFEDNLMSVWDSYKSSIADVDIDDSLIIEDLNNISNLSLIDDGDDIYAMNLKFNNISKVNTLNGKLEKLLEISSRIEDSNVNEGVITVSSIDMPNGFTNPNTTYTTVFKNNRSKDYDISSFRNSVYLDNCIVGIKNEGEVQYLQWLDVNGNILKNFYLLENEAIQRISVDDDNNIVFTSRYLDNCYVSRLTDKGRDTVKLDKGVSIHGLSISDNKIILSTVKKNELSKLTIIDFDKKTIKTMNETILGGVFYPILHGNDLYFIRKYYDGQSFSRMDINQLTFDLKSIDVVSLDAIDSIDDTQVIISDSTDYNAFNYLIKNVKPTLNLLVIPELLFENAFTLNMISVDPISLYSFTSSITGEINSDQKALITRNSFVYDLNNNQYYAKVDGKLYVEGNDFYSTGARFQLGLNSQRDLKMNKSLDYGLNFDFNFSNENFYLTTFQADLNYKTSDGDYTKAFINSNLDKIGTTAFVNWSYSMGSGLNRLNYFLIAASVSSSFYYYLHDYNYFDFSTNSFQNTMKGTPYLSLNNKIYLHLPYLIPDLDDISVSYDLPTSITAITNYDVLDNNMIYSIDLNTTLFAYIIDSAYFEHLPLYYRTLNLELGYNNSGIINLNLFSSGSLFKNLSNYIYANAYVFVSPTSTASASSGGVKLGANLKYYTNNSDGLKLNILLETQLL